MNTSLDIPAITIIQSYCRGYLAREKTGKARRELLPYDLFLQAKSDFINHPETLDSLPKPPYGKSSVYLPTSLPIVLKKTSERSQRRFEAMNDARSLSESRSYRHLIIPKARRVGDFIIEARLPIQAWHIKEQMGLYYENKEFFTEAAKEFMDFLCHSNLRGITTRSSLYGLLSNVPMGRYDNICFFMEKGVGKMGLVDLERFSPTVDRTKKNWCYHKCETAIILFPYHFYEIIAVAKKYDPKIEEHICKLLKIQSGALYRFQVAYADHMTFLQHNPISFNNRAELRRITPSRIEQICMKMVSFIKAVHNGTFSKCIGCLGNNQESIDKALASFTNIAPNLCEKTVDFLSKLIEKNFEQKIVTEKWQLAYCRTFQLDAYIQGDKCRELTDAIDSSLSMMVLGNNTKLDLVELLLSCIFTELYNGGEIALFHHKTKLVFC